MPDLAASPQANAMAAHALFEAGCTTREVAKRLAISPATAWRLKQIPVPDSAEIQSIRKSLSDRMTLASSLAVDVLIDQAHTGKLDAESPTNVAKCASIMAQAANAYAALSGTTDTWDKVLTELGASQSHSVSRITLREMSIEQHPPTPQPVGTPHADLCAENDE